MTQILSLDGIWNFLYSPQPFRPGKTPLPERTLLTGQMVTPGYWDDHYDLFDEEDFFGLRARFNPDYRKPHYPMGRTLLPHAASSFLIGTGFYQKTITPKFNPGDKAVITVGPAMWGSALFCNGTLAGAFSGYSTETEYDVSTLLRPNQENDIVIVVCNDHDDGGAFCRLDGSHDGIPVGARPGQHRGLAAQGYQSERAGICGGVSLKITNGNARIADWFMSTDDDHPLWHVRLEGKPGLALDWAVADNGGKALQTGRVILHDVWTTFASDSLPAVWSDEAPALYTLAVTLRDGDAVVDSISRKWGQRTLAVTSNRILVNGAPAYFCGVTEHCYFPETTNPHADKAKYLRDLGVLRNAGFNFIRCHTWCPPEAFYDACDELGFYVQTELPSVWSFTEAEAVIRQIRRHPSAVILCEGNEKIIDGPAIERLRKLADTLHDMAPGMLFNPQEAMRGIEYAFSPEQKLLTEPFTHDPERLDAVRKFTDVFGCLGGEFSYSHDAFPGADVIDAQRAVYGRPCLTHEAGILGGYLDFSLEKRYEGTFIGTDMFQAAREHMTKRGVYHLARTFYEKNCLFTASVRKQLIENIRACNSITGFDFLGGIDTHWHLIGYPCGVFNEFYEEKFGETAADVRKYNGQDVLLCSIGKFRNRTAGTPFAEKILLSHFGAKAISDGILAWTVVYDDGSFSASGETAFGAVASGTVTPLADIACNLPDDCKAHQATITATAQFSGKVIDNNWKIWVFPCVGAEKPVPAGTRIADSLAEDDIAFMENGGALLLTAAFPAASETEFFRTCTSGRSLGHAGNIIHPHPIWSRFAAEDFGDWQFYPMMDQSHSIVQDAQMPPFNPILELIPCFKLVKRKALLAEYAVGNGRLFVCGLKLDIPDPAAQWLKHEIIAYLASRNFAPANQWPAEQLRKRLGVMFTERIRKAIDAGGRPLDL